MSNQFVQVPPDSTGKKMQTFENVVGANTVESEAVTLVRSSDNTEIGTAAQPARVDPTGTTTQPVSGTVTANQGTANATPWNENKTQVGGIAVQAAQTTSTDGTGANEVVRATQRRFSQILTTTPLAANGVFNSAWFDTNQTGDVSLCATVRSDQTSAVNGFLIQEADDTTDANFQFNITAGLASNFGVGFTNPANTTSVAYAQVRRRFWRVQYTNGATLQGSFKLAVTANPVLVGNAVSSAGGAANLGGGGLLVGIGGINQSSIGADANAAPSAFAGMSGFNFVYGPNGTTNNWYWQRTPIVFKTVSVSAVTTGNSAVWTPTAGKKFRLMKFQITAQGLAATATAAITVSFQDSASGITIGTYDVDVPAIANVVSGVNQISGGWIDIGNGLLSAVANNVLNFNISAAGAGTVGTYRVNVCGTEE